MQMLKLHVFTLILAISTETFAAQCDPKRETFAPLSLRPRSDLKSYVPAASSLSLG